jgi:hypothetical protein
MLTGDTVLPGRLFAFDFPAYLATLDRLVVPSGFGVQGVMWPSSAVRCEALSDMSQGTRSLPKIPRCKRFRSGTVRAAGLLFRGLPVPGVC